MKNKEKHKEDKIRQPIMYDIGSCSDETKRRIGEIIPLTDRQIRETKEMFSSSKMQVLERPFQIGQIAIGWLYDKLYVLIGTRMLGAYDDIVRLNERILIGVKKTNRGVTKEFIKYNGYDSEPRKDEMFVDWRLEAIQSMQRIIVMIYRDNLYGTVYQRGGFYVRCEKTKELRDCLTVYIGLDETCGYKTIADREYMGIFDIERMDWVIPPTFSKIRIDKEMGFLWGTNEVRYSIFNFISKNQLYYLNNKVAKQIVDDGFHHLERVNDERVLIMTTDEKGRQKYIDATKESDGVVHTWIKNNTYIDAIALNNKEIELIRKDKSSVIISR